MGETGNNATINVCFTLNHDIFFPILGSQNAVFCHNEMCWVVYLQYQSQFSGLKCGWHLENGKNRYGVVTTASDARLLPLSKKTLHQLSI